MIFCVSDQRVKAGHQSILRMLILSADPTLYSTALETPEQKLSILS